MCQRPPVLLPPFCLIWPPQLWIGKLRSYHCRLTDCSVDPRTHLTCDVTSLLHLFMHLSYSLFSNVNKLRFHTSVRGRGVTHAICRRPLITEAPVSIHGQHTCFLVHRMTLQQIFLRALRLSPSVINNCSYTSFIHRRLCLILTTGSFIQWNTHA